MVVNDVQYKGAGYVMNEHSMISTELKSQRSQISKPYKKKLYNI